MKKDDLPSMTIILIIELLLLFFSIKYLINFLSLSHQKQMQKIDGLLYSTSWNASLHQQATVSCWSTRYTI